MRRLSCARRKVATAGCEGGGVMRGDGGGVFPHYKFNLTNGSENLETMEYMKCGRVYHADGDVGWFRRQYCQGRSIFSESATARGPSGLERGEGRGRKWFPPGCGRTAKHASGTTRSRARGGRRTVAVVFGPCRANAATRYKQSSFFRCFSFETDGCNDTMSLRDV